MYIYYIYKYTNILVYHVYSREKAKLIAHRLVGLISEMCLTGTYVRLLLVRKIDAFNFN